MHVDKTRVLWWPLKWRARDSGKGAWASISFKKLAWVEWKMRRKMTFFVWWPKEMRATKMKRCRQMWGTMFGGTRGTEWTVTRRGGKKVETLWRGVRHRHREKKKKLAKSSFRREDTFCSLSAFKFHLWKVVKAAFAFRSCDHLCVFLFGDTFRGCLKIVFRVCFISKEVKEHYFHTFYVSASTKLILIFLFIFFLWYQLDSLTK